MSKNISQQEPVSKADATRRALLDAALRVIGEKGYSAATVSQIVEEAGVSKGLAYYHFSSKAEMAQSILVEGIGSLIDELDEVAARADTAKAAMLEMIEVFASRVFENGAFGRFFVSELWREGRDWSELMRGYESRLIALLQGQFERGKREGTVRSDVDSAFAAVATVGTVLTSSLYYLNGASDTYAVKSKFIEHVVSFIHAAIS